MEPRIHRSNMPVYLREDIEPMEDEADEFSGPWKLLTYAIAIVVGVLFWTAVFA